VSKEVIMMTASTQERRMRVRPFSKQSLALMARIYVRMAIESDFGAVCDLYKRNGFAGIPSKSQFLSRLRIFPEGQWVAIRADANEVVGVAFSLILPWKTYHGHHWEDLTADGTFESHDETKGRTLFRTGLIASEGPLFSEIACRLHEPFKRLAMDRSLEEIRAVIRVSSDGRLRHSRQLPEQWYVSNLLDGRLWDIRLSNWTEHGFQVTSFMSKFRRETDGSGGAVLLKWSVPPADKAFSHGH